jgi:hypothetical protein
MEEQPDSVSADAEACDPVNFDPVPVRPRLDGWTPERQREFVEALADTGVVRIAAARVGMTAQSAARLRRRADARDFDRACAAAMRIGARRLLETAFERAMEGTVKQHFYHGELKGEERVFDNRLLTYLLGKLDHLFAPDRDAEKIAATWDEKIEVLGQDEPEDDPPDPERDLVWDEDEERWWTRYPPPAGFAGEQRGEIGDRWYRRTLTEAEMAVLAGQWTEELAENIARGCDRRNRFFGFDGGAPDAQLFSLKEEEPLEPSEPFGDRRLDDKGG